MSDSDTPTIHFKDLNLPEHLITALDEVGYESPSPIQAQAIPHLLAGLDLLGRAPTGTGKTAAFALPLLSRVDPEAKHVQVLTLCPTRELAIQVSEAFQRYASHMPGFHVLPIYGGAEYGGQLRMLKRGVQVVVGTPGRIMDHMRKGTLKLNKLQALVLDEADEMLRMGFKDEVEWILEQTPERRQMALFSATMPKGVERIARAHLSDPQEVSIQSKTATAETIRQRYWFVSGLHKLDALTRILEVEPFDAILMFARTKMATTELAEKLEARGYPAAALNGDMAQAQREQMVNRLKRGSLDILVATDIAARGLDVDRISHVVNYDIPYDTESYIHRIGRTGRAGRSGEAILFVAPRERRMLKAIERATRQPIEELELPTTEVVTNKRIGKFKQKITDTLAAGETSFLQNVIEQYEREHNVPAIEIAAGLAKMLTADRPLEAKAMKERKTKTFDDFKDRPDRKSSKPRKARDRSSPSKPDDDKNRYRISVGYRHGVRPGNIVGAIANEGNLDSDNIGHIEIETNFSLVDLPKTLSKDVLEKLKNVKVSGKRLDIVLFDPKKFKGKPDGAPKAGKKPFGKSAKKKPFKKASGKPGGKKPKVKKKPGASKAKKKPKRKDKKS
ncbi:MAG: DEAD/DEAH box helicase [Gammaproteobacteria bacterium]